MKWSEIHKLLLVNIRFLKKELLYYLRTSDAIYFLLFSIIVGLGGGFGAILFRWLIQYFRTLFFDEGANLLGFLGSYYVILIPLVGGMIIGPLIHFFAREAKGHGVPEVISAMVLHGGTIRPRVAVVKALASSICIGSGEEKGQSYRLVLQ